MDAHPQLRHPLPTLEGIAEIENRGQTNVPKQIEGEKWMRILNCATHSPRERALQKLKTEGKLMYLGKLKVKNGCAPSTAPSTAHARGHCRN